MTKVNPFSEESKQELFDLSILVNTPVVCDPAITPELYQTLRIREQQERLEYLLQHRASFLALVEKLDESKRLIKALAIGMAAATEESRLLTNALAIGIGQAADNETDNTTDNIADKIAAADNTVDNFYSHTDIKIIDTLRDLLYGIDYSSLNKNAHRHEQ